VKAFAAKIDFCAERLTLNAQRRTLNAERVIHRRIQKLICGFHVINFYPGEMSKKRSALSVQRSAFRVTGRIFALSP